MSFLSSLKKALGFPDEYDELDDPELKSDSDDTGTPLSKTSDTENQDPDNNRSENADNGNQKKSEEFQALKKQYHALQQQCEELQAARLSADRQRRALTDRVKDLEKQVLTFEAEREQFQLENRSMANKLRVAAVRQGLESNDDDEAQRLAMEIVTLNDTVANLSKELDESKSANRKLNEELTGMQECAILTPEQEQAMAEIEEQIKQFDRIKKKKDGRIAELTSLLDESVKRAAQVETEVAQQNETIETLKKEIESLHKTIETNLYSQATQENELREEIKRLSELADTTKKTPAQKKHNRPNKKNDNPVENHVTETETTGIPPTVKLTAIDELMDDTDWFVAPEPVPVKKSPEVEEDFGYKEPSKKTSRDDDKQLSLW